MKYKGILNRRRIYVPEPGLLASSEDRQAFDEAQHAESTERLAALFRFYGAKDWRELALYLAVAHVPGMGFEKAKRGPATVWNDMTRAELRLDIEAYVQTHGGSTSHACSVLAGKEPWKTKLRGGRSPGQALRRQYNLAINAWVRVLEDARAYDQLDPELKKEADRL